jgi:nondiscriminating aspartyl-tRNA synthetase
VDKRILITDCLEKIDQEVEISGWVYTKRDHGKLTFLDIYDRSGLIQVVGVGEQYAALKPQDVVQISGNVQKRPDSMVNDKIETGTIELKASSIKVLSEAEQLPFDISGKELDLQLPTLLDNRTLTLRHSKVRAIFKVQSAVVDGFRKAAESLGCTEIFVPTITASSTEGGAEVFKVDYYGHQAYLTQSPQLYKQMLVPVFERVFTIAHAYRAEPSVTTRHLSESTQLDCEFGFVDFPMLLNLVEEVATKMLKHVQESCADIFKQFELEEIAFGKIPRLTLREAQEVIFAEFQRDNRKEKDLTPQDEVDLCKWAQDIHKSDFVTITHFPISAKPFYTMPDPKDPEYSLSYDLLFRGVEVLSGSQRENDYKKLVQRIEEKGMDPKNFEMYLQAFKYGMPPEGGLSFGLERITMHILNLKNVREASLFPRDMERVDVRLSTLKD